MFCSLACFHPKKGWQIGLTENGKPKFKITPWSVNFVERTSEGWKGFDYPAPSRGVFVGDEYRTGLVTHFLPVPCGHCVGCRLDYAKQWSARLQCEYQLHDPDRCWFITLTYDDQHLPLVLGADSLGEACLVGSLRPADMTKFLKRLRRYIEPERLRFFYSAEYGSRTHRPHYHMIAFNLLLSSDDLIEYEVSELGDRTWKCPTLEKIWKNGSVIVGKVSLESCAYVARYCLKKIGDAGTDYSDRVPEFVRMSRCPGIGHDWLLQHPEVFEVSQFPLSSRSGCQMFQHPRYFMKFLEIYDPDRYDQLHRDRVIAGKLNYDNLLLDGRDYLSILHAKELTVLSKCGKLKRKYE